MAEEGGFKQSSGENALFWLIVIALIIFTLGNTLTGGGLGGRVSGDSGSRGSSFGLFNIFGGTPQIPSETPLGTRIAHEADTVGLAGPGEEQLALAPAGSRGSIIGGPVNAGGTDWWKVRYTNGVEGWVPGDTLSVDAASNGTAVTNQTPIGSRIVNGRTVDVFAQPGTGQNLGSRPKGAEGTLLDRGNAPDGSPVLRIDYDFGPDGWVPQDAVEIDPAKNASAITEATPVGSKVLSDEKLTVREQPRRSAERVSEVSEGVGGTVVDGPVNVDGELWFKVKFSNGVEGWVLREDLSLDTANDPFAVKDTTPLGLVVQHVETKKLWSEPGGGREIGEGIRGVQGVLVDGPVVFEGERWWQVEYDDGVRAWVTSEDLEIVTNSSRKRIRQARQNDAEKPREAGGGFLRFLKGLGIILSIFFVIGVLYTTMKLNTIRARERKDMRFNEERFFVTVEDRKNPRWEKLRELMNSDNENDWRAAIIEADVMLDELLHSLGYTQKDLGEKLKSVEKSDFTSIDKAWEAHLFRNRLAHDGSSKTLDQREAKRIIDLYREVFEEFELI